MALPICIKRYRTHLFSHVVKTEEAKSWLPLLKNATWILWSLGGGIIDLQGMEEVATEQGGQGISRHAPCTDSHLDAPLENGLHLLAYNVAHTLSHICPHSCTHTLYIYVVALGPLLPPVAPAKEVWGDQGGLCSPCILAIPN